MPNPRVPTYRHHRPSGRAVVTLDGTDHYLGKWNTEASRTEYQRLVGEWLANGCSLPQPDGKADLRICELVASYLDFAAGYYSDGETPGKEYGCMRDAAKPLAEFYSRTRVAEFGPLALKAPRRRTSRRTKN